MPRLSKIGAAALGAFGWTGLNTVSADFLVVAGGGGSGRNASSGGGAGGYRTSAGTSGGGASAEGKLSLSLTQSYTVTVGAGGAGATSSNGTNGGNSVFSTITSTGGGAGVGVGSSGGSGGSGGGGGGYFSGTPVGGAGTANQGYAGGNGSFDSGGANANMWGGGGGGAGGVGGNATNSVGGTAGAGVSSSINGSATTRALGGVGGGGATGFDGTPGGANTGTGGGGSGFINNGAAGGSGVVIISYVGAQQFGGGVVTSSGGNTIHTFNTSGTLSPLSSLTASYLIVAGGGGGATGVGGTANGGGAGAGGLLSGSSLTIDKNSIYAVTVGAGGATNNNGSNSTFSMVSTAAVGGGSGGYSTGNGQSGGSGGGASSFSTSTAGAGTSGQGNAGGTQVTNVGTGGGGGAGAVGGNASGSNGGNGGAGSASSITGTSVTYAGGGGGSTNGGGVAGTGGTGGGGAGGVGAAGTAGTANLGGGGGGGAASAAGGAGGSGIVIISYPGSTQQMAGGTVTVAGGNVIHTFTSSGYLAPIFSANNSLRFRSSVSAYLNRTPATASNRQTWTWSGWIKRGTLSVNQAIFSASDGTQNNEFLVYLGTNDTITIQQTVGGTSAGQIACTTNAVFRDPSAWYHIVLAVDTTQATSTNRLLFYVNGVSQTFSLYSVGSSINTWVNNTNAHAIAKRSDASLYFDGYLAEVNFIDGQALTPNSFGYYSDLGVWQPIRYGGSYGTNGFYLPFTNTTSTTTLGYDFSPNGNNWTTNNISLTSGSTYDSMTDVPTNTSATVANYSVLDPLDPTTSGNATLSNANLTLTTSAANRSRVSSIGITNGKWYAEVVFSTSSGSLSGCMVGISQSGDVGSVVGSYLGSTANSYGYNQSGDKYNNGGSSAYGASYTNNDVIGIAFDADNGTVTFYKNNSSQGTAFSSLSTSATWFIGVSGGISSGSSNIVIDVNFGQRPFTYTPPTNFVALNTFNLPTPTIGATASSQANKYMDVSLYTGNGSTQSITGVGFQPDWVWLKARSAAFGHGLFDVLRGTTKRLSSDGTGAEGTESGVTAFNSDGFTIGSATFGNNSGTTMVGWQWKANGTGVTNTAGSITSTVSANTTAGFSIVTYTGNGSNSTIGHGLGVAPSFIIAKARNSAQRWTVYTAALGNGYYGYLNETFAFDTANASLRWNTAPTSSVFGVGTSVDVNNNTTTYVAYCFAPIAGYSAFGSYTGNGSTDGPFVFTGFRPRFIMIKRTDAVSDWWIWDTARNTFNQMQAVLYPNLSSAEVADPVFNFDALSNGFKNRSSNATVNGSGATYIYMAFAESPFKFSNAR